MRISFYTDNYYYRGWKKAKDGEVLNKYLDLVGWVRSGNKLRVDGQWIETLDQLKSFQKGTENA